MKPKNKAQSTSVWLKIYKRVVFVVCAFVVVFAILIASIRWIDPLTSSVLIQENIAQYFEGEHEWKNFDWRDLEDISPFMAQAVIAAEDQRFYQHWGIDTTELRKAWEERHRRTRGASTITQQVVKNLFLWNGKSYLRKLLEAGLAPFVDIVWGKDRVLEVYLNIIEYGPWIYGVENASQTFFNKPASKLNKFEAARLAAVLPNPKRYSVNHSSQYILDRQSWILRYMK